MEREYAIPHNAKLLVENGQLVRAGDAITDGPINPQEYLETRGREAVQRYLVKEVQRVYRSQGVTINDKHIEIIVRQMLRKVRIDQPGDTELLPFELVDKFEFEEINNQVLAEGGEPATAETVLLGVTKASLNTSAFLAAASFQETTRVLTEAAINGARTTCSASRRTSSSASSSRPGRARRRTWPLPGCRSPRRGRGARRWRAARGLRRGGDQHLPGRGTGTSRGRSRGRVQPARRGGSVIGGRRRRESGRGEPVPGRGRRGRRRRRSSPRRSHRGDRHQGVARSLRKLTRPVADSRGGFSFVPASVRV